ncbi:hypothetical protein [uncultured Abyssibacter sp.]|uniref:hypothetical protein n=1 Tax=uncultured Abyssibacter sp. TaxID=2320202 RepID=UPI0032B26F41|tara:strand:- start:45 stop:341 length:297 start_codon:yes stop_codon:yes gene_type:complete
MSVSGQWKITISAPTGPEETVLDLHEHNGTLTGSQTGRGSTTEISDGRLDGATIAWVNNIRKPMKIKAKFTAEVDGDRMNGKVKVGLMPAMKFTAVRA